VAQGRAWPGTIERERERGAKDLRVSERRDAFFVFCFAYASSIGDVSSS